MNQPACFGSLIASHITRAVCFQPRVWVSLRFLIITSAAARALPLLPAPNLEERRECPALPIHPYAGGDTASAACFILFYSLLCMRGVSALLPCVCPPRSSALVLFQTPSEKGCALQFATKRARQAAELNRSELKQPAKPGEQSILVPRSMARAHSLMQGWKSVRSAIDRSLHGQGAEWRRVGTWSREGRKKV